MEGEGGEDAVLGGLVGLEESGEGGLEVLGVEVVEEEAGGEG